MPIDFQSLAARLLQQSRSLLAEWFPRGRLHGREFCIGDLAGSDGESLKVNIDTGSWSDFATGDRGGDLISLFAAINGINQAEAALKLDGDSTITYRVSVAPPVQDAARETWTPIIPAPADAPPPTNDYFRKHSGRWLKLNFAGRWAYHDRDGALLGYAVRFEWYQQQELCKDVVPQVYAENGDGMRQWRWKSMPVLRSLYNLPDLYARPSAPIIVVEGEKKVEALRVLAPQYVGITWPGGCAAWRKADWTALAGRNVLLWPDADRKYVATAAEATRYGCAIGELIPRDNQPGMHAMWQIAHALLPKCPSVKIIIPEGVSKDGWDAADALNEGWDWERLKAWAIPRVVNLTDGGNHGTQRSSGVDRTGQAGQTPVPAGAETGDVRAGADVVEKTQSDADDSLPERGDSGADQGRQAASRVDAGDGEATRTIAKPTRRARARGSHTGAQARVEQGILEPNGIHADEDDAVEPAPPLGQISQWLAWGLDRTGNGSPIANLNNAVRVLQCDPSLRDLVWFDEFLGRMMTGEPAREWIDADDINTTLYIQRELGLLRLGRDIVSQAIVSQASRNKRNCVREYLDSLTHDGVPRIDTFFVDIYGSADSEYVRAASRNFWLAIVARVYKPGCKFDHMIVLEGGEDLGKSLSLEIIGGKWYAAQHESATNTKAFAENLQGKLLIEIEEMDSFSRAEVTTVKKITSAKSDRYRPAYGRHSVDHPRQCVMVGTTNRNDWNKSDTGARRMWPISCHGAVELERLTRDRDQFFAEAVVRHKAGERHWLMPKAETKVEQRQRYDADAWMEPVSGWLLGRGHATVNEIAQECLHIEMAKIDRSAQMRICSVLRALGWFNTGNRRFGGKVKKVWEPGADQYGETGSVAVVEVSASDDLPFK